MTEKELNDLLADLGSPIRAVIDGKELRLVTPEGQVALRARGAEMIRRVETATQRLWALRLTNQYGAPGVPRSTFGD